MKINYEKEIKISHVFLVDFLIGNTIIEVNGPHHYINNDFNNGLILKDRIRHLLLS